MLSILDISAEAAFIFCFFAAEFQQLNSVELEIGHIDGQLQILQVLGETPFNVRLMSCH